MVESLRTRLLVWHTAIVTAVVAIFGGTVCYLVWRTGLADMDAALACARADDFRSAAGRPAEARSISRSRRPTRRAARSTTSSGRCDGTPIDWSEDGETVPRPSAPGTRTRDGRRELTVHSAVGRRRPRRPQPRRPAARNLVAGRAASRGRRRRARVVAHRGLAVRGAGARRRSHASAARRAG